jgi:DNA-binding NarL/FixJ family response regulator
MQDIELVSIVSDEQSAIAAVRKKGIDVMILDLQLRQGTGFGVLQALGADRPIAVVLTNYAIPAYRLRALELGVEYFLNKSLEYDRLPEVIRSLEQRLHS